MTDYLDEADAGPALFERLGAELDEYTGAERAIAGYMLQHRGALAFETAASLADRVGVSAVTVGRFCRRLGYRHFKDLKNDLRQPEAEFPWLVGPQLNRFVSEPGQHSALHASLQQEMAALAEVYALAGTPQWEAIANLLAGSGSVHVAGMQTERGIGVLLATQLQYVRRGVHLADPSNGSHADVFAGGGDACLVLIDMRRYSRQTYLMAERAHAEGIPLVVITDKFCDWASRFTPHVIAVSTETGLFWSSPVAMSCAVNLLINRVIGLLGTDVEERLARVSELYQGFTGYLGWSRRK